MVLSPTVDETNVGGTRTFVYRTVWASKDYSEGEKAHWTHKSLVSLDTGRCNHERQDTD